MVGIQPPVIAVLFRFQKVAPSVGFFYYSAVRHQPFNTDSGTTLQLKVVNYA
jgi:hypothetical protein